jgi:hypothetical protein
LFRAKEIAVNASGGSMAIPKERFNNGTLLYRSPAFDSPTVLAGPMDVELYVSTTAKDATLHVMVMDEDDKGKYQLIAMPGTSRLTYVDGKVEPVTPGKIYKVTLEPWWFAREFGKGHRLAVMVFSDQDDPVYAAYRFTEFYAQAELSVGTNGDDLIPPAELAGLRPGQVGLVLLPITGQAARVGAHLTIRIYELAEATGPPPQGEIGEPWSHRVHGPWILTADLVAQGR